MYRTNRHFILAVIFLVSFISAKGQADDRAKLLAALEKDACVTSEVDQVKICKYDYISQGENVEAFSYQPPGTGRFPAVMLIPGYQGSATNHFGIARVLAGQGFAAMTVAQPGFGKSAGKADYGGPKTLKAMTEGFMKFRSEPYVDPERMGVFGYSRGGMVASLMAVELKEIKAVVLGAGIYDFKRAYDEMPMEAIKANMLAETGMTPTAIEERSSILRMSNLRAPVIILHGEKDRNVPVSQALLLRDRLTELKKDFEIKLYSEVAHGIGAQEVLKVLLDFFGRRLKGVKAEPAKVQ
jgi:dipeptidyl aminopeptidase/acylaminoacyl peptidase